MMIENIIWIMVVLVSAFGLCYFRYKSIVFSHIVDFINEAESMSATGAEKFIWVVEQLTYFIPSPVQKFITTDMIEALVQRIYDECKAFADKRIAKSTQSNEENSTKGG